MGFDGTGFRSQTSLQSHSRLPFIPFHHETNARKMPQALRHRSCKYDTQLLVSNRVAELREFKMPEPDRIIRLKTVINRSGLSRSTVYRKISEGTFPPKVKLSLNGVGWRESELNRWIANPAAYRPLVDVAE